MTKIMLCIVTALLGVAAVAFSGTLGQAQTPASSPAPALTGPGTATGTLQVRQLFFLTGHTGGLNSASFSPDGTRIVTASNDKTARLWNATSGNLIAVMSGHTNWVLHAVFSPDGTRIVTASADNTARLWNGTAGTPLATLSGHTNLVLNAKFSPDGTRILTVAGDKTARLWDGKTGALVATLLGHTGAVTHGAFSPDGSRILTIGGPPDISARTWDGKTGAPLLTVSGSPGSGFVDAEFSPDGTQFITASSDRTAKIFNTATGALVATLRHTDTLSNAVFSPDGSLIVTGAGFNALVWDAKTYAKLTVLSAASSRGLTASISPNNARILGKTGDVMLWDAKTYALQSDLSSIGQGSANDAEFSPDSTRLVVANENNSALVWQLGP
jgi:WD40 repeat protein